MSRRSSDDWLILSALCRKVGIPKSTAYYYIRKGLIASKEAYGMTVYSVTDFTRILGMKGK